MILTLGVSTPPRPSEVANAGRLDYPVAVIPRLAPDAHLVETYQEYLALLAERGFAGEIQTDYAARLVAATDNSVYQLLPQAVIFPKHEADVQLALGLLFEERFRSVKLSPRGGGTGTNGQSLTDGIVLDVSRHLRRILALDLAAGHVTVEPGVVLDQLNAYLAPHGVFFAPNLSPSNRATIGGMINTDASGKGSRIYGKTSEHVLGMRAVLLGGEVTETRRLSGAELGALTAGEGRVSEVHREVDGVVTRSKERIERELPRLARFLTGYDLAHVRAADGAFDLGRVLSGSEGTLGVITEARLRLTPIPKFKQLVVIRYTEFDAALRAANLLVATNPGAIETIDDTIVNLAKHDVIWHEVVDFVESAAEPAVQAVNLVEFESDDAAVVESKVRELTARLDGEVGKPGGPAGYSIATRAADIKALWTLRKKGVGLLGNAKGERRPVPFVEDTVVPPEKLADYIQEFRAVLNRAGLRYGMFGHVDVGCLHVRPALDMKDEGDEKLLRHVSEEVVRLTKKYGGVLWGEHGRGYRSEFTPTFFGPELYAEMRAVKSAFDPHNQLNPGKLATPTRSTDQLVSIDSAKRGSFDRQISAETRQMYAGAVTCNGNGACFDWNPDSVMCPSSKVTSDRIHSPKGRAGILREWLRLLSKEGHQGGVAEKAPGLALVSGRAAEPDDFSHQVYDAMNGCLACKACATQCPIHVDVPALRANFLEQYHSRYRRPLKDWFVIALEPMLGVLGLVPRLANWLMGMWLTRRILAWVGIVDSPKLAERSFARGLRERGAEFFSVSSVEKSSPEERARTVLLAQDVFTTYYEPGVALATYDLLTRLGRRVLVLPFLSNGKALHVKGFVSWFDRLVRRRASFYRSVAKLGVPIVGVEPAVTLTYRDEYVHVLGKEPGFRVELLQEYLAREMPQLRAELGSAFPSVGVTLRLFGHCTERTYEPKSQEQWRSVVSALGGKVELESVGCCGMCGVYGHEAEHYEESRGVFDMSWRKRLPASPSERGAVVATGHSCRSQVKRFAGFVPAHPAEALVSALDAHR